MLAEQAAARVDAALAPITAAHPQLPVQREVVGDTPLRALLRRATDARLLVVGHRSAPAGIGNGSRLDQPGLVEFAPCPVAVIKPTTELRPQPASARSGDA